MSQIQLEEEFRRNWVDSIDELGHYNKGAWTKILGRKVVSTPKQPKEILPGIWALATECDKERSGQEHLDKVEFYRKRREKGKNFLTGAKLRCEQALKEIKKANKRNEGPAKLIGRKGVEHGTETYKELLSNLLRLGRETSEPSE